MQKYSGESSHLLLGIDSHMWVEFVVSYLACFLQEIFLQVIQFFSLLKNQHYQIPIWSGMLKTHQSKLLRTPKCFMDK